MSCGQQALRDPAKRGAGPRETLHAIRKHTRAPEQRPREASHMKVGVMLRHLGQHGGGVLGYTFNLLDHLPRIDPENEYFFLVPEAGDARRWAHLANVNEIVVGGGNKLAWDQLKVPRAHRRHHFDVLFNPKYSLPLSIDCRTVFVCHGLDWYVMPWGSKLADRLSHKYLIPRYARKANGIIAVSDTAAKHLQQFLGVPADKVRRIYLGVNPAFATPPAEGDLRRIRAKYSLPERFFLYVGQIYPPKNFGRLLKAYAKVGPQAGIRLVVAGEHRWLCGDDLDLVRSLGIEDWVIQPGWIGHEDLPTLYRLSHGLLLPSLYEACPSPILEAMASGSPFVTANRYGTAELAGPAGILVNPEDVDDIARGMRQMATDETAQARSIEAGYNRVAEFSWQKCAEETRDFLVDVARRK
jgi:glycosyltransferase involved in cell wall biosynthesis